MNLESNKSNEYSARCQADTAIRKLWCALNKLSKFGENAMTDQDIELWKEVTNHNAIQDRLELK